MKRISLIVLLLSSNFLYAQTSQQSKNNPSIKVSPAVKTTVIKQPSSMPNSNTNPTTGTVFSLKTNKEASKSNKQASTARSEKLPLKAGSDTTVSSTRSNSSIHKKTPKKKKQP